MEWYEKMEKFLFVNDFGQYLLNFLADRAEITGQSNSEKWNLFFEKVEGWKNQFFISSEPVELYGVNGWYVDLEFSRFRRPDGTEFQMEEYAAVLLLADLVISLDGDAMEYECLKNTEFEKYFPVYYDYPAEACAVLSNTQFCDELQNLYDRSFERFQYYVHQSVSRNPKVIEKLKTQYPVFAGYLAYFEQNLKESTKIVRLNSFGGEEEVWYMAPVESYVFLISVGEII